MRLSELTKSCSKEHGYHRQLTNHPPKPAVSPDGEKTLLLADAEIVQRDKMRAADASRFNPVAKVGNNRRDQIWTQISILRRRKWATNDHRPTYPTG